MTHPQHQPIGPARPVSEAERNAARRQIQSLEARKRAWWAVTAKDHLIDAVRETFDEKTAEGIVDAMRERDFFTVGARFCAAVEPYLDDQCVKAHDPEG